MGNFKEALAYLRIATQYKDSLTTENMQKQLGELQIKYEVNKLNNEKSQLEIKNKRILVICLSIILIIEYQVGETYNRIEWRTYLVANRVYESCLHLFTYFINR